MLKNVLQISINIIFSRFFLISIHFTRHFKIHSPKHLLKKCEVTSYRLFQIKTIIYVITHVYSSVCCIALGCKQNQMCGIVYKQKITEPYLKGRHKTCDVNKYMSKRIKFFVDFMWFINIFF